MPHLQTSVFLTKQFIRRSGRDLKKTSSGRDLVIFCGRTGHQWNPVLFREHGFYGSEEAVINLSRELSKLGWSVTVYNNCGHDPVFDSGVIYRPFWEFNPYDRQDAIVIWRKARFVELELNAPKIFVDFHDAVADSELSPARLSRIAKVFVKSQFQRSLFPKVPDEKFAVIPNGVDLSLVRSESSLDKDPWLLINTSAPDRGLDVLPKLFRQVKERIPSARLKWAYGWDRFIAENRNSAEKLAWMKQTQAELAEAGIESLGRLSQADVGRLYQRATILAYPTEFAEIDCISVKKAQAASCFPIATDFGALQESIRYGFMVHSPKTKDNWNTQRRFHFGLEDEAAQSEWVDAVVNRLQSNERLEVPADEWIEGLGWPAIAARWNEVLRG